MTVPLSNLFKTNIEIELLVFTHNEEGLGF